MKTNTMKLTACLAGSGVFFFLLAAGLQGVATNRYVATNVPGSAYPFDSWAKAGTNIIEVVAAANSYDEGDMVFVSNGTYYLTNQISITKKVIVTNFTGDRAKVIINGNYPTTTNRCFYMENANAIVSGFTITNGCANTNAADSLGRGGGVDLYYGAMNNCLITGSRSITTNDNMQWVGGGGGVVIWYGTASCCFIIGNTFDGMGTDRNQGGGGISIYRGMATNCYIADNRATNGYAGGLYIVGGKALNCTIANNIVGGNGSGHNSSGGGVCGGGSPEIQNCIITNNSCHNTSGGGMYLTPSAIVKNCLIQANRGYGYASPRGAGIYIGGVGTVFVDSCTIVSNQFETGNGYGGGIAFNNQTICITSIWNCIIYDNYAGKGGVDLYDDYGGKNYTALVYSCTSPGSGFNIVGGITNSPPSFVNADNGNYRLKKDSPCVNKGTNRPWMTGAVDNDGNPRIRYGTVDMGVYEYVSPGTLYRFH